MKTYCKLDDWVNANKDNYEIFRSIYPFLKTMSLPLSYDLVLSFYNADIINRNFTPNPNMQNCYELLFTYYCENYDRTLTNESGVISGKTQLEYLFDAFPEGIKKTVTQANNAVSSILNVTKEVATYIIIAIFLIVILMVFIKFKK